MRTIKTKALAIILPVILVTLLVMSSVSFLFARTLIQNEADQKMDHLLDSTSNVIRARISAHSSLAQGFARTIEQKAGQYTLEDYHSMVQNMLEKNGDILYGLGVFFAPYQYKGDTKFFSTYGYHDGSRVKLTEEYSDPSVNYPDQPWYSMGAENKTDKVVYTDPFYDPKINATTITASIPFYNAEKKLMGVVTGDIEIGQIQSMVRKLKVGKTGSAFLVDRSGVYLANPDASKVMKANLKKDSGKELKQLAASILSKDKTTGLADGTHVYAEKIEQTGWVLVLTMPDAEINGPANQLLLTLSVIGVVALVVIGIAVYLYISYISKNLQKVNALSTVMAEGDMTAQLDIRSADEFHDMAENFNAMTENLRQMIGKVSDNAQHVLQTAEQLEQNAGQTSAASEQITAAMQQVAAGSMTQLNSLEESVRAMTEMSQGIQVIAEASSSVSADSRQAALQAKDGKAAIERSVQQMAALHETVEQSAGVIAELGMRSKEIGEIISVISSISDQTNLLALNAAIEAARAGEHGRGFAIVAEEVRKLAEQSAESAAQISDLISYIQGHTNQAVQAMEKGTAEAKAGKLVVEEAGHTFASIVALVEQVSAQIQEVSAASEQMAASAEELSASVENLSGISRHSSVSTQEAAAAMQEQLASVESMRTATTELRGMSQSLEELVAVFKI
nr:methyl-accepting chemotaxis protein [Ectobacillus ponti]